MFFWSSADFFFKINFFKKNFKDTIRVSISLDPDQARHFVSADLDPNCLQMSTTKVITIGETVNG